MTTEASDPRPPDDGEPGPGVPGGPAGPPEPTIDEDTALDLLVVLFYLPVALGSLLYLGWTGGRYALWARTIGEHPVRDALIGAAFGLGVALASRALVPLTPWSREMARALAASIGRRSWLTCLVIAVSSAIGEELLFRGVLQERLGIAIATVLFAAAHFPAERALWPWPLLALPIGLAFGGLYTWSGAVCAPIVAHAVINLVNLRQLERLAGTAR